MCVTEAGLQWRLHDDCQAWSLGCGGAEGSSCLVLCTELPRRERPGKHTPRWARPSSCTLAPLCWFTPRKLHWLHKLLILSNDALIGRDHRWVCPTMVTYSDPSKKLNCTAKVEKEFTTPKFLTPTPRQRHSKKDRTQKNSAGGNLKMDSLETKTYRYVEPYVLWHILNGFLFFCNQLNELECIFWQNALIICSVICPSIRYDV